jgi:Replication protein A C terminal
MTSPQMIPELEKIASRATVDLARLLREAYELGREHMRRELMALLSPSHDADTIAPVGALPDTNVAIARTSAKAPPGTVRPAILSMIESSNGVQVAEIIRATGFKENSVRGTVSTLAKEGKIYRNLNGWVAKKLEASARLSTEASNGSDSGPHVLSRETAAHDR